MKGKLLYSFLLFFLCFLYLLSGNAAAQHAEQDTGNPLAATGLLAFPGERAEDILLRAHRHDRDATLLAALGYLTGSSGFPKAPWLSYAWATSLANLGDYEGVAVTVLLAMHELSAFHIGDEDKLFLCAAAKESSLAKLVKDASIGDIEATCSRIEKASDSKKAAAIRERAMHGAETVSQIVASAVTLMRELPSSPASEQQRPELDTMVGALTPGVLLLFAGTTDEASLRKAAIQPKRLLDFIALQAGEKKDSAALDILTKTAGDMVAYLVEDNATGILEILRAAHSGEKHAMRSMAEIYSFGIHGAIRNEKLALAWLQHPAFSGDAWSMLRLAGHYLARGELAKAWAWADIATIPDGVAEPIRENAEAIIELIEAQASDEVLEQGIVYEAALIGEMERGGLILLSPGQ